MQNAFANQSFHTGPSNRRHFFERLCVHATYNLRTFNSGTVSINPGQDGALIFRPAPR
ncbi:hypothetical protein DESC_720048 [Desulfosarcina cetonica]|nr:hypothetical protein DESC_720048 [Desulfosarcina cetonica]